MASKTFKEWLEENPRDCLSMAFNEYREEQAKTKTIKAVKKSSKVAK